MRMLLNEFLDLEIKQLNFEEKNLYFAHEIQILFIAKAKVANLQEVFVAV